jgi:hypothetical protein
MGVGILILRVYHKKQENSKIEKYCLNSNHLDITRCTIDGCTDDRLGFTA